MKTNMIFAVVMIAFFSPSCKAMERPPLLSPVVTEKGVAMREQVVDIIADAVYGPSRACTFDLSVLPPEAKEASPHELYKMSKRKLEEVWHQEVESQGISNEQLEVQMPSIEEYLMQRIEKAKEASVPASSPLKRVMNDVATAMNLPVLELRAFEQKSIARCVGSKLVVCNPTTLAAEAHTPKKIRHVLGHETRHADNKDIRKRLAYKRALKALGKNPKKYKETQYFHQRIGETFADIETASVGKEWAQAYVEITGLHLKQKKDYIPTTHPSRLDRHRLAIANNEFYEEWLEECERKSKLLVCEEVLESSECMENPKKVARNLLLDLEKENKTD